MPLSYIAGAISKINLLRSLPVSKIDFIPLTVGNESIQCFDGPKASRKKVSSPEALRAHGIEPITLASKEPLGIVNGTAFSAAVAALAIDDAMHLALLAQVLTAMGTEALTGARGNYAAFIHATARPHPGQVRVYSFRFL
jgi:phenylalanine ammonia-lyase